eukprot:CAMPEP_0198303146 /NCGR_PEP_ID=MMETSP1449-20131203/56735_1 /TAXON_ID=420275 /ORGANISM="Attheya septentrionalis, Strain CCMP2084" /LENGTH=579 /DNA_ID=CAMNT_0044005631 /DNA_START=292 /DNA_END=2029 /DNA_ORIENTATION=-
MGVAFGPLLILFMGLSVVNTLIIQSNPPDTDRKDLQIPPNLGILSQLFGWAIFLYSAVLLVRASYERAKFRRRLMIRLRDGTIPDDDSSSLLTSQQDAQLAWQQKGAHRTCCACYSYDTISPLPTRAADQMTTGYQQAMMIDDEDDDFEEDTIPPDLCTCIWKALSAMCCGYCCGCWCQCCGMCATGQEEREINRLVPKQERMMDYVTFEPYSEYFPKILELRKKSVQAFWDHCNALSQLSIQLIKSLGVVFLVLLLIACTKVDNAFTLPNLLVLLATFGQAFLILHFVHWRWNRLDLSFDAVVKFFSCGFLFSTIWAFVYETAVMLLLSVVEYGIVISLFVSEQEIDDAKGDIDIKKMAMAFMHDYLWVVIVALALNAFVVAALVEELCKYFGFWMVEHPDFLSPHDLEQLVGISLTSSSAMIRTIGGQRLALPAVNNLMYIFVYTPTSSFGAELSTLLLRSLFPVHPLCAAIQSIGVCRRDLEGDRSCQLGRILFPAILLHGSFDFALMVMGLFYTISQIPIDNDDNNNNDDASNASSLIDQLPSFAAGFGIMVLGIVYYIMQSKQQSNRLRDLESA